ncbi:MAG: exodeoxyribonuclease III [Planctomycetota bacterium]
MRVTTWNVNGLRAAIRKGLAEQLDAVGPDVLLLQEVRARPEQLPDGWAERDGWHITWHPAEKPGYAGTAVWTRQPHTVVATGLEDGDADPEGRVLRVKVGGVQVVSVYLPSGSSSDARQQVKEAWMQRFLPWAAKLRRARTPTLLGGDLNIAHTTRDIYYAKSNQNQSGFLPHERAWFGELLGVGWRDLVRRHAGDIDGPYSWWSNRGQARQLDRGWRIDYLLANGPAAKRFTHATTHRDAGLACSDHAPVSVDLEL